MVIKFYSDRNSWFGGRNILSHDYLKIAIVNDDKSSPIALRVLHKRGMAETQL